MKSLLSPIILLGLSVLAGCGMIDCVQGSGEVISQNRQVSAFESVTSNGSVDVVVTQGATQSLRIEGDDNILPLIKTEVSGGTLTISTKDGSCYNSRKGIVAYVTMPTVRKLTVNGSGDFSGATAINSSKLDLEINGSGSMNFNVVSTPVTASIDGSGDVMLQGSSPDLAVSINGSGDVRADKMPAEAAKVEVEGSGSCALNVTRQLSVNVGGSGDVTYRGNPASVKTSIHGSGTLTKIP